MHNRLIFSGKHTNATGGFSQLIEQILKQFSILCPQNNFFLVLSDEKLEQSIAVLFRNRTNLCRRHHVCSKDVQTTISAPIVPCVSAMLAPVLMASRSTHHVSILNDKCVEYHS